MSPIYKTIEIFTSGKHYKRLHPKVEFPIGIGLSTDQPQVPKPPLRQMKMFDSTNKIKHKKQIIHYNPMVCLCDASDPIHGFSNIIYAYFYKFD